MITVKYTAAARKSADLREAVRRPMVLAEALARRLLQRVAEGGDTATPARQYSDDVRATKQLRGVRHAYDRAERAYANARKRGDSKAAERFRRRMAQLEDVEQSVGDTMRPYVISDEYARLLGVTQTRYRSSAAFHEAVGTKPGTYRVSGGMWRGLQVRNVGASTAIVDFGGSSPGGTRQSQTTASGRTRSRAPQVRNQVKAGTVFRQHKVNPIQATEDEQQAILAAVTRWSQVLVCRLLGATIGRFDGDGDRQLLADILRHYDGGK